MLKEKLRKFLYQSNHLYQSIFYWLFSIVQFTDFDSQQCFGMLWKNYFHFGKPFFNEIPAFALHSVPSLFRLKWVWKDRLWSISGRVRVYIDHLDDWEKDSSKKIYAFYSPILSVNKFFPGCLWKVQKSFLIEYWHVKFKIDPSYPKKLKV